MEYQNNSTESRKNKHLNFKECIIIQIRAKDGLSPYNIGNQ
nr:hypothetical protein [Clostridium estertheticum]